jgi:ABC-2 type transport system permease protein
MGAMTLSSFIPHPSSFRSRWRTYQIAAWLGWKVESNWADPLVFFIYAIMRPISTALILLLMYLVIAGPKRGGFFDYIYISNALYLIAMQAIANMSWTILEDREHYRTLKYIYTAPVSLYWYLIGRASARMLIGIMTCIFLLVVGTLFLGLHLNVASIQWGWLGLYFLLGMVVLISFGIIIAGIALVVPRNGEFIGEIMAGMLLLVCSVYFPPDILPSFLRKLSLAMPVTYWLEGMRRALCGGILQMDGAIGPISPMLAAHSNSGLALILAASAMLSATLAYYFYQWVERLAKARGMIDMVTGY